MLKRHPASLPLTLGLLFTLALGLIPITPALGENIGACQGSLNPATRLTLGGRTLTPTLIIQASGGQPCPTGETTLNLVSLSHTIIVSPNGTPTQNGTALLAARDLISNSLPSATNPWLLKLEPGNYDLGNQSLTMLPYVDLEGSGEGTTTISSTLSNATPLPSNGTLVAAANSEVRSLKITNAGAGFSAAAIYIPPSLSNVRFNQFTAKVSGSTYNYGLFINGSTITLTNSTLTATANSFDYGLYLANSTVTLTASTLTAANGSNASIGLIILSGTVTTTASTLTASGSPTSYGLYNTGGTPHVANSQLFGATSTSSGLTVCPFSVNATTFAPLNAACQ
jgi:hypothetical protein